MEPDVKRSIPLGLKTAYVDHYDPTLLFPIARATSREKLAHQLDFDGHDIWRLYELSWLNPMQQPMMGLAVIYIPANSPCTVESKSLKLYTNSFHQSVFDSVEHLQQSMQKDISAVCEMDVMVDIAPLNHAENFAIQTLTGVCLDDMKIAVEHFEPQAELLARCPSGAIGRYEFYSHALRTLCPVTAQPDFASVYISYQGYKIQTESLLAYLISYRLHQDFHEHCIESIYSDLAHFLNPQSLLVCGYYTRRGGIDINPIRASSKAALPEHTPRLLRQ